MVQSRHRGPQLVDVADLGNAADGQVGDVQPIEGEKKHKEFKKVIQEMKCLYYEWNMQSNQHLAW